MRIKRWLAGLTKCVKIAGKVADLLGFDTLRGEEPMLVQVHSANGVEGSANLTTRVESLVDRVLGRYRDRITRIEVHLGDTNADKGGLDDKRCSIEARLAGLKPIAVVHHAGNFPDAITGAVDKLERLISNTLGKLDRRAQAS
jgi:ribosome-associated translation inhibitor RaiA